jgi:osmotically inducible lipoprotein OsmB
MLAMRKTMSLLAAAGSALALAACGHNMEQRAATGGVAGAVVAGPVGAVAGAATGAAVSAAEDQSKPH